MSDVVVTVPKKIWKTWLAEGGLPGEETDEYWVFTVPSKPRIEPGERVYIVAHGQLRGYAPLVDLLFDDPWFPGKWGLERGGNAVAVTIPEPIKGFQGYRYRWWDRRLEKPFAGWKEE